MRIIDPRINRERNKTLKQYELSMWEKLHFVSLGVVLSTGQDAKVKIIPSISYDEYDMKKGFDKFNTPNKEVNCLVAEGLDLSPGDIVLVVFTDLDIRDTVREIRKGKSLDENFNTSNTDYHNLNYGIIINKIII